MSVVQDGPSKKRKLDDLEHGATTANHYRDFSISGSGPTHIGQSYQYNHYYEKAGASEDPYEKLLKTLSFERIVFRVNNVKKALLSTCEWLLQSPSFREWYNGDASSDHNGFFWIRGKPGCGKSTLMKAALEWAQNKKNEKHDRQTVVPYFFNARALASLEKSALGLYRTIVHHLLSSHDFLRPLFMTRFALKDPQKSGDHWTVEELQGFLYECVESGEAFDLCLFIDALDEAEYETDVQQMISFLIQLSDRASAASGSCRFQVCLSSRHYPYINIGRGYSLIVERQLGHGRDIETYIGKQLTCSEGSERDALRDRILTKSARVFLWVVLVVNILNKLDNDGALLSEMQARLDTIPPDLNELFRDVLLKSDHGSETSVLFFRWLLFSRRPLGPAELYVAIEYSRSSFDSTWYPSSPVVPPCPRRLDRYILNCSRGLVEIVDAGPKQLPAVQFIHETVREFLLHDSGLVAIVPNMAGNLAGISHEILRIACLRAVSTIPIPDEYQQYYTDSHQHSWASVTIEAEICSKLPFIDYAVSYLFKHAEEALQHNVSQQAFLNSQMDRDGVWSDIHRLRWNFLGLYVSQNIEPDATLLYFIVDQQYLSLANTLLGMVDMRGKYGDVLQLALRKGNVRLARDMAEMGANVDAPATGGCRAALDTVSYIGDLELTQFLLDKGAGINTAYRNYGKALLSASENGHSQVVELLLDRGTEVNITRNIGPALQAASSCGRIQIVELLLDRGAEVNTVGGLYGTALQAASAEGHIKTVQLLLDKGAEVDIVGGRCGTALQTASIRGHIQVVQLLLDRGAKVDIVGGYYGTALRAALRRGHFETAQLLRKHGAKDGARQ